MKIKYNKILFAITLFFTLLINVDAATVDTNFAGGGVTMNTSHGSCYNTDYNYTPCNNLNFLAINVQLVYYDSKHHYEVIDNVILTNSGWGTDHIDKAKRWDKLNGINYSQSDFSRKLNNLFNTQDELRAVFKLMGKDYDKYVDKIKKGDYPDHQKIGENGIKSTGLRLVVEPIYTYMKNVGGKYKIYYGSARNIAEIGLKNSKNINKKYFVNYANAVFFERDDIGINANKAISQSADAFFTKISSSKNSYGRADIAFYDHDGAEKKYDCDPDKDGIKTCCTKCEIKSKSSKNNNTTDGCLKRKITDEEYEKNCTSDKRCDPDKDGIKYCCNVCNVSDKNINNRKDTTCLKRAITSTEVKNYCSTPKSECNYTLNVDTSDDCYDKTTGIVGDGDDEQMPWKCVFKSQYSGYSEVKSHYNPTRYGSTSNSYCRVSCKQNIEFEFPNYGASVEHGRFLVVQESSLYYPSQIWPIKYKFTKECRTSSPDGYSGEIDIEKFKNDMAYNEDMVEYHWNQMRIYETYQSACNSAVETGRYTDEETGETTIYYDGDASYHGNTYYCSYTNHSGRPSYYSNINYETYEYQYYSGTRRNSLINEINACSSNTYNESMSMDLDMDYEADIYGGNYKLNESSYSYQDSKYYTSGNSIDNNGYSQYSIPTATVKVRYCTRDNYCNSYDTRTYYSSKWVKKNYEQDSQYKLDNNLYKYVSKYSGQSYSETDDAGDNYITVPVPNLPVHYSQKTGLYKYQININKISSSNKFYPYLFNNNTFAGDKYRIDNEYTCKYRVTGNDVNPDIGPLVFREIPLDISTSGKSLAFLTQNGNFRTPGTNWNKLDYVSKYITNNRNVKGRSVYKLKPMYEVELTPNLIRDIRLYNKSQNAKLVTIYRDTEKEQVGVLGYSDVDGLDCKDGTDCISNVIRKNWGVTGCAIDKTC